MSVHAAAPVTGSQAAGPLDGVRIGVEVELLAPPGGTRADLAEAVAQRVGGRVRRAFHTDSEPSLVRGVDHFIHLTPAFDVLDAGGVPLCRLVDDITIQDGLDRSASPRGGWYRIVGDEPRLMRLVHRWADPDATILTVLDPLAAVFGTRAERVGPVVRLDDASGATLAMAAPLPGERERPCEVVTAVLEHGHEAALERLLAPARDLGFSVPAEAAVHVHLDAGPLREVHTFVNLVRLFSDWRDPLRRALRTNPRCRRLAPLPEGALALAAAPPDRWEDLAAAARGVGLTKFADVNLTRLVTPAAEKDTVEVRVLPGALHGREVVAGAVLVHRLLQRCRLPEPLPRPGPADDITVLLER